MMRHLLPFLWLTACVQPLQPHSAQVDSELKPGETRSVELWMLEFNVEGYEQSISLDTLNSLPQSVLDDIWLLDMPLLGLVENSLAQLRDLPIDEALLLPLPAQNMRTLMRTTPDNAVLEGTSLEELLGLSVTIGIPPANTLAELFDVGVTEPVLPLESATIALVEGLIATHPASQTRLGAVNAEHPEGVYSVAENSLPITVGDVVSNFEDLADRFAPAETQWGTHPGFIDEAIGFSVVDDEFELLVKVQINAVPFRGVDLTNASNATVNSTGAQIDSMFQTDDPHWLRTVGMVEEPFISDLTIHIVENDQFLYAGDLRDPAPLGNGAAWDIP
ncbi:MAG: hypothetical protein GWP91_24450, partial [Rhodobacterales bacterium]|nr:hypothetical protein [Rhodobacterales bacterium]